jgi:ubiquinone/menaquinone biosynthesis C-methylase UbiE
VVELVGDAGVGRILDLGCGAGTFALRYAREGLRTVGVDASPQVIATARALAREEGLRHCQFVVADVSHLSIRAESFNLIIAADIFEHLPMETLVHCLEECWRVLVPGGRLIVHTTPTRYEHMFDSSRGFRPLLPLAFLPGWLLDRVIEAYDRFRYERLYRLTRGETRYDMYARSVHPNPLAYATLRRLLFAAGFVLDRYLVGNMADDLERPAFARASRLFPHAKNLYKHIWAVCRKPRGDDPAVPAVGEDAWGATEIREFNA